MLNKGFQEEYSKGVLKSGCSKVGAQKWVLKNGVSKGYSKGYAKRELKRGAQKWGTQHGVLKKGYSRIFNGAENLLRVLAAVFAGVLAGSDRWVLTGY